MRPQVATLESLFFVTSAINDAWIENEAIDWSEAEQLVSLVRHELNSVHSDALSDLYRIIAYADTFEEWDCEEVARWPALIMLTLSNSDKKYTYRKRDDHWEVYGLHLSGEEDWVATVVTETVAQNMISHIL